jgi:integrase
MKRRQYSAHWERHCRQRGHKPYPANASAIAAYIEDCAESVGYLTIKARIDGLKATHISQGFEWPQNDSAVRWALERVRGASGSRSSRPLVDDDLDDLSVLLSRSDDSDKVHDWALIALGSEAGLDAAQLARLQISDIEFVGVTEVCLYTFGSAAPQSVYSHTEARRCAVYALRVWVETRRRDIPNVFYRLNKNGGTLPLRSCDINGIVMRRMAEIGRSARFFSARSLRGYALFGRAATWRDQRQTSKPDPKSANIDKAIEPGSDLKPADQTHKAI